MSGGELSWGRVVRGQVVSGRVAVVPQKQVWKCCHLGRQLCLEPNRQQRGANSLNMKTVGAFSENLYSSEEKTVGLHQLVGVALVLGIDGCVMIGKGKNKGS